MSVITLPAPAPPVENPAGSPPAPAPNILDRYFSCVSDLTASPAPWDRNTVAALLALVLLWAARVYATWATWGNLSVDTGHEMYVPALLAEGKVLYRDVWFGFPPLAPYFNAALFRVFGMHLSVLYWAGSLAALGCAVLLFLAGKRLSSPLAGWTAGAVILMEAFHAWHFSFPLPYGFAAVYGCLAACLFLWCAVHACGSADWRWMFGAGTAAAVALLLKVEIGAACYITFFLLLAARGLRERSWKRAATDLAAGLPGMLACAMVLLWMVSLRGLTFLIRENLAATWPGSFLMKTYARIWLENTGLAFTTEAFLQSAVRTLFFAGVALEAYLLFWRKRFTARSIFVQVALFAALLAYFVFALHGRALETLAAVFFPQDMVLYVAIAALPACWRVLRQDDGNRGLAMAALLTFAGLLAVRTLMKTNPWGYSIYYNGPAVLSFLILARPIIPRAGRSRRTILRGELLLCLGCLVVAAAYSVRFAADRSDRVPLATERGTILVPNQVANSYRAGIALMKEEAARGGMVLSVPEDTSLYFLSGTQSPTRLFLFVPGVLAPGKMTDDVIREIEQKPVRYLLWSNRSFPDYGVPRFGTDFDQALGDYLVSKYLRVGPLIPDADLDWQLRFTLWERKPEPSWP
jgi:hypothetical protein